MATKRNGQVSNGLPNNMCIAHDTGGSMLEPGWSQDHPDLEKKIIIIYKTFKKFMILFP